MNIKKKKELQNLADLLPGVSRNQGWSEQLALHQVFLHWEKLVDVDTARHAVPLKITGRTLWLEVENSAWLQQLQYQKPLLLDSLNKGLKRGKLDDIRLVLAVSAEGRRQGEGAAKPRYVRPPAAEQQAFARLLETIDDEEAREALMRFWYLSHACRRPDEQGLNQR